MVEKLNYILGLTYEEAITSSNVNILKDLYKNLLNNGMLLSSCTSCYRKYYVQLKLKGMETIEKLEQVKNRTCKPNWNGNKYINSTARFWNDRLITDSEAQMLLEGKHLTNKDFVVLPVMPEAEIKAKFEQRHAPKKKK
jgi:hypothetical protein